MPLDDPASLALTFPSPQAGGGGSFSGGGGGGGGDGDGIGMILWFLIRLAIEVPIVGVPVLVGVVAVFVVGTRRGWWKHQERVIHRTRAQRGRKVSGDAARVLAASDPAFDEVRFLARVRQAFLVAQESWCKQDLEPLRPFVSDGVFERFSLQIEEQKKEGWQQGMDGTEVDALTIAHVETGTHFDTVTVRIPFRSTITRRSLENGKKLGGSELPRSVFAECWSFVRRRGAKTLTGEGLLEGKCPNCAAPLTLRQSAKCEHCDCLARSGQFDWVLAEITQASEWRPENESEVTGLRAYAANDPGINVQVLEDRSSVAFWRKCAADREGDVAPLTRLAEPAFCESYALTLVPPGGGRPRVYTGDCAVGSVRTLGLLAGAERDRAVVEVVWDGRRARVEEDGRRRLEDSRMLRRTLFVFARAAGQRTSLDDTFTTAHCKTCGAHDLGGTDPACPWCGAPRTGDRSAWLLADVFGQGSPEATRVRDELLGLRRVPAPVDPLTTTPPGRSGPRAPVRSAEDLLVWASVLVHADGEVTPDERKAVQSLARRADVSSLRVDMLLSMHRDDEGVPVPADALEARAWLEALTELALSDGSLSSVEKDFLASAAQRLGLTRADLKHAIGRARGTLYRESRDAARSERR